MSRWDGETLVVDTIGFNDKSWVDSSGYSHGEQLHLVERFHKTDAQTLRCEVTIEDPEGLQPPVPVTHPWNAAPVGH